MPERSSGSGCNAAADKSSGKCPWLSSGYVALSLASMGPPLKAAENWNIDRDNAPRDSRLQWGRR